MAIDQEETVAVYAAPDAVTAGIICGVLESEGINAVIGEQVTDSYGGVLQVGEAYWGEVRVPAGQVEAARALLGSYDTGGAGVSEAELTEEAAESSDPDV